MIAVCILFLREGLEASLVLSILLSIVRQLGMKKQSYAIWTGVLLGFIFSCTIGFLIYSLIHTTYLGSHVQIEFETITYIIAITVLTGMTFWMQIHSKTVKTTLTKQLSSIHSQIILTILAFSIVGREGVETVIFTLAFIFKTNSVLLLTGAVIGLGIATGICILIYYTGYHLNYRVFFRITGLILLFFTAGLVGDTIQNIQELHWISFGTGIMWNTAGIIQESSTIGDILHNFLGYAESPTVLQCISYLMYLGVFGVLFYRLTQKPSSQILR